MDKLCGPVVTDMWATKAVINAAGFSFSCRECQCPRTENITLRTQESY